MKFKAKDIAKKLSISPSAVSIVLNNKPGVSEETRKKVLKTIEQMGYNTTLLTKSAFNHKYNMRFIIYKKHGYVVSDTPFFSALMEGIDREARSRGYNLILTYIDENKDDLTKIINIIKETHPDGIMLLATEMTSENLKPFQELNIPLLLLDSYFENESLDTVIINNIEGAYKATCYLAESGHIDIGYLHSSVWINNFDQRMVGFKKAIKNKGLRLRENFIFPLESTIEGSYRDMLKILNQKSELPTAMFADNDIIAFGAIKAMKEVGLRIPQDISIVGFDDMPFCELIDPPLTTIMVYKQRMGMIALKRLVERIEESPPETIRIEVNTTLIERNSVMKRL
jgi:LacI family transcriptional regulator